MVKRPSPNFGERPSKMIIDMLVLHYTGMESTSDALDRLCNPTAEVSAHYLIDEGGTLYHLVPEENRAWHAGVSSWRGYNNVNDRSIGIELSNPGHEFGYCPYSELQMLTLIPLAREIISRHSIPARNVVGHSDIAPTRKQDPGELFDWARMADHGIGRWPLKADGNGELEDFSSALEKYGYNVSNLTAATSAFQRHFRPSDCNGLADQETENILQSIL